MVVEKKITKHAIVEVARLHKRYNDCNPDVGMGPMLNTFVEYAEETLGIKLNDSERIEVCDLYRKKYPKD